jgi:hypothetical protein
VAAVYPLESPTLNFPSSRTGTKEEAVMKRMAFVVFSTLLALPVAASAQGQTNVPSDDPLLGTWHLDVSKSRYSPGPPPVSQTRIYEKHQFGIKATVRTVYANGRTTTVQSVYDYDKQEHPVTGSEDVDAIVVKRTNAYMHEATQLHGGQEIGTFLRVISNDGKQMTVTLKRRTPPADNVEIYVKEEPADGAR